MQSDTSPYLIWGKKKMLKLLFVSAILNHWLYPHFFDVAVTKLSNLIANFPEMLSDFLQNYSSGVLINLFCKIYNLVSKIIQLYYFWTPVVLS